MKIKSLDWILLFFKSFVITFALVGGLSLGFLAFTSISFRGNISRAFGEASSSILFWIVIILGSIVIFGSTAFLEYVRLKNR